MPVTKVLPYQWYDTPNIRVGTLQDFEALALQNQLEILDSFGLQDGREVRFWPNARASRAVFKFKQAFARASAKSRHHPQFRMGRPEFCAGTPAPPGSAGAYCDTFESCQQYVSAQIRRILL
jgi:hypothetical protein